jgi:hypothetical protein
MTDKLKSEIKSKIAEIQDMGTSGDCHCFRGDMMNPPEQCDNCWNQVELQELKEWVEMTSNNLANQELSLGTPATMSPDCVRTWWADYTEEMAQHQLTELQMNILFCYSVLPIIEGELR